MRTDSFVESLQSLRENSMLEGHGFSRAEQTSALEGFSP
jgi:hypothetical protein